MSRENLEVVRRVAAAFEQGGFEAVREHFHPQIEWHEDPSFPESGIYHGLQAVEAYGEQFMSEFATIHYEPGEMLDSGDHVVTKMSIKGVGRASGASFEVSAWWAMTFRDGKIIRGYAYLDRDRALEAVGLRE